MLYDPNINTGNPNEKFTGFCKDLLDRLATDLQFQYHLYLAPDKQYGKMKDNTSWTGMVGELIKKVCYAQMCVVRTTREPSPLPQKELCTRV